ncbi:hypothetical protein ACKVV1_010468 [Pyricularia oryzae]
MFRAAGVPPDVVNLVIHRPEDAQGYFEALISHPAVRKCNFIGSTAVMLQNADLERTAEMVLLGALLDASGS